MLEILFAQLISTLLTLLKTTPFTSMWSSLSISSRSSRFIESRSRTTYLGSSTPASSSILYTFRLSWMSYCMWRSLMTYGSRRAAYSIALLSGNPFEWKEMRQSTSGHSSTGLLRMTFSGKTIVQMNSNSFNRANISFIGFDSDFLAIEQMPTTTCFDECGSSS